jgi:hypothetical protein
LILIQLGSAPRGLHLLELVGKVAGTSVIDRTSSAPGCVLEAVAWMFRTGYAYGSTVKDQISPLKGADPGAASTSSTRQ